jgi:hypothetical protein
LDGVTDTVEEDSEDGELWEAKDFWLSSNQVCPVAFFHQLIQVLTTYRSINQYDNISLVAESPLLVSALRMMYGSI